MISDSGLLFWATLYMVNKLSTLEPIPMHQSYLKPPALFLRCLTLGPGRHNKRHFAVNSFSKLFLHCLFVPTRFA